MTTPGQPIPPLSEPPTFSTVRPRRRARSRARIWVVTLAIFVIALASFATYLWVVNTQWQDQNDQLRAQAAELSATLDQVGKDLDSAQLELTTAKTNLAGATGKVTDLADSSANARDQSAFLHELTDSFLQCEQAQAEHITHLESASLYTASSLAAEGREVKEYCEGVEASYNEFIASQDTDKQ